MLASDTETYNNKKTEINTKMISAFCVLEIGVIWLANVGLKLVVRAECWLNRKTTHFSCPPLNIL